MNGSFHPDPPRPIVFSLVRLVVAACLVCAWVPVAASTTLSAAWNSEALPAAVACDEAAPAVGAEMQRQEHRRNVFMTSALAAFVTLVLFCAGLVWFKRRQTGPEEPYVAEAYLIDLQATTAQPSYRLGKKATMIGRVAGRDNEFLNYVVIPQSTMGRRHALIEYKDYGYWLMDQGSINGTFVNGALISSEVRLKHGDRLRFHKYEFEFALTDVGENAKTEIAGGGAVQPAKPAGPEAVTGGSDTFDLTGGLEMPAEEAAGPVEGTLVREEPAAPVRGRPADDETLMPAATPSAAPATPDPDTGDETLMPGSAPAPQSSDATLMPPGAPPPASSVQGSEEKKPNADEGFFDITGGKDK
jgi:hypothetical protein